MWTHLKKHPWLFLMVQSDKKSKLSSVCFLPSIAVPPDLTPEERLELENIRRRKQELLVEIQRLRDELSEAMNEVEGLEANEGR